MLFTYEQVKAYIQAAVISEREACAKVCEELETHGYPNNRELKCAAAIRARSTKE